MIQTEIYETSMNVSVRCLQLLHRFLLIDSYHAHIYLRSAPDFTPLIILVDVNLLLGIIKKGAPFLLKCFQTFVINYFVVIKTLIVMVRHQTKHAR